MSNRSQTGQEALNSFIQSLYQELFSTLCAIINQKFPQSSTATWITLLDVPGGNFNTQWSELGNNKTSNLNDLVYNYINERLAELFYDYSFREPAEVYAREQVMVDIEKPLAAPHTTCRLIDQKAQLVGFLKLGKK